MERRQVSGVVVCSNQLTFVQNNLLSIMSKNLDFCSKMNLGLIPDVATDLFHISVPHPSNGKSNTFESYCDHELY